MIAEKGQAPLVRRMDARVRDSVKVFIANEMVCLRPELIEIAMNGTPASSGAWMLQPCSAADIYGTRYCMPVELAALFRKFTAQLHFLTGS